MLLDDLKNHFLRHFVNFVTEGAYAFHGAVQGRAKGVGGIVGAVAGMEDFHGGHRAVSGDAAGHIGQFLVFVPVPQVYLGLAGAAVDTGAGVPDADGGCAADGLALIIAAAVTLRIYLNAGGGVKDTVAKQLLT